MEQGVRRPSGHGCPAKKDTAEQGRVAEHDFPRRGKSCVPARSVLDRTRVRATGEQDKADASDKK